jgi:hypothetical protein
MEMADLSRGNLQVDTARKAVANRSNKTRDHIQFQ